MKGCFPCQAFSEDVTFGKITELNCRMLLWVFWVVQQWERRQGNHCLFAVRFQDLKCLSHISAFSFHDIFQVLQRDRKLIDEYFAMTVYLDEFSDSISTWQTSPWSFLRSPTVTTSTAVPSNFILTASSRTNMAVSLLEFGRFAAGMKITQLFGSFAASKAAQTRREVLPVP